MICMFDTGIITITDAYLTWKIYNFHSLPINIGCEVRSPEFVHSIYRYTLVIWPRGQKYGQEGWFGICLYRYGAPVKQIDSVQFGIVGALGDDIKTCTVECSENNIFRQDRFMEWSDFVSLGHKITPNGSLTIICRLSMENCIDENTKSMFSHPMNDNQIYQSGNFPSADSYSMPSTSKMECPMTQASRFKHGYPANINSFYNNSSCGISYEYIPESAITEISDDFKMPYNNNVIGNKNTTQGLPRTSKRNKPWDSPESDESLENSSSDSIEDSPITIPETNKSAKSIDVYEVFPADCFTTKSDKLLSKKASSNSSSQTVYYGAGSMPIDSLMTTQPHHFSNSFSSGHPFQHFSASSAANSCQRSNHPGEILSSDHHYTKGLKAMSQHYKNLYLTSKDFDVTILMGGKEFKVHRLILKSRSPAFDKLLSEDNNSIININPFDSCDSSIFHDFLLYIYSGEVENMSLETVPGLYCAACKFDLPELKEDCIRFFKMSLSIDNITDIIRLLDNESELQELVVFFLAKNLAVIMKTDEWKQLMIEETARAIEYQLKALDLGYEKKI